MGIHRGVAVSVTFNERIDYFGQTVNIVSRVQGSAGGSEIYLTEEIYTARGSARTCCKNTAAKLNLFIFNLRGIEQQVKIYRVFGAN